MGVYEIAGEIAKKLKDAGCEKVGIISAEGFATIVQVIKDDGAIVGQSIGESANVDAVFKSIMDRLAK